MDALPWDGKLFFAKCKLNWAHTRKQCLLKRIANKKNNLNIPELQANRLFYPYSVLVLSESQMKKKIKADRWSMEYTLKRMGDPQLSQGACLFLHGQSNQSVQTITYFDERMILTIGKQSFFSKKLFFLKKVFLSFFLILFQYQALRWTHIANHYFLLNDCNLYL